MTLLEINMKVITHYLVTNIKIIIIIISLAFFILPKLTQLLIQTELRDPLLETTICPRLSVLT